MSSDSQTGTLTLPRVAPRRILLVEDSADVAEAMLLILGEAGHEVEAVVDGREALARFKPEHYDLVITDYSMPRMNGVEFAEIVRRRAPGQKILMVTAYAFTIAAYDGRPLPVDMVLKKPFKPEEFGEALRTVLPPVRRRRA